MWLNDDTVRFIGGDRRSGDPFAFHGGEREKFPRSSQSADRGGCSMLNSNIISLQWPGGGGGGGSQCQPFFSPDARALIRTIWSLDVAVYQLSVMIFWYHPSYVALTPSTDAAPPLPPRGYLSLPPHFSGC